MEQTNYNIAFRVDSATEIGAGHVIRCITLADILRKRGYRVFFVCRAHKGNLIPYIIEEGYDVFILPVGQQSNSMENVNQDYQSWLGAEQSEDALQTISLLKLNLKSVDWLVVDHYAIDHRWHQKLGQLARNILVIDDLANRKYYCDILLDPTYGIDKKSYLKKVNNNTKLLLGPEYALLRSGFQSVRKQVIELRKDIKAPKNILLCFGGGDSHGYILELANILHSQTRDFRVNIIITNSDKSLEKLRNLSNKDERFTINTMPVDMVNTMSKADFSIGAAGGMCWERACLGLPTILFSIADNQKTIAHHLIKNNIAVSSGSIDPVNKERFIQLVNRMMDDINFYSHLVNANINITDGKGAERVVNEMEKTTV
jgi:UDP-2,4-diacetamido-2,4,6-trideoxy-beta-L-altropyranose hydrolase